VRIRDVSRHIRAQMLDRAEMARPLVVAMIIIGLILLLSCSRGALSQTAPSTQPTTVILVRHAEKAAEPANDPGLTPDGERRAHDLAQVARDAGVTAVITTQFARTRATAQPLASALSITPEVIDARGATHAQDVATAVRRHAGQVVLVVGHSNTIPAIIAALGAAQPPPICDQEYDNLYVVTVPASGPARLIHARYGAPTPVAAGCGPMMR